MHRGHKKRIIECAVFNESSVRSSSTGLDGAIVLGVTSPAAISNKHFDNLAPADKKTRIRLINVVLHSRACILSSLFRRQDYADEGCKGVDQPPRVPLAHTISVCPHKSILRFAGAKHALPAQHLHLILLHALPSQHSHLLLLHESTAQCKTKAQTQICLIDIVLLSLHTF